MGLRFEAVVFPECFETESDEKHKNAGGMETRRPLTSVYKSPSAILITRTFNASIPIIQCN
jgi:hypothetical protein